jgi:antitoxin CptB
MTIDHDSRLRRLKFRAWHRGFREADLILGPFADTHGPNLTPEQLDTFETLMEESDREIYAWIVGQEPTPGQVRHRCPEPDQDLPLRSSRFGRSGTECRDPVQRRSEFGPNRDHSIWVPAFAGMSGI